MTKDHPNIKLLLKLDIRDLDASAVLFSNDFVWHYFNPSLPDVEGDYFGVEGLKRFFKIIAGETNSTLKIELVSAKPIGEELVVVHARDTMVRKDSSLTIDDVVVWRIVDGQITEAWNAPSAFSLVV